MVLSKHQINIIVLLLVSQCTAKVRIGNLILETCHFVSENIHCRPSSHCSSWVPAIDINRTPVSDTRLLSYYQLTHDKVMQAWTSDIHAAARQEPTGGPVIILYSIQSSSYIYRYTVLIRYYCCIAIYT